jgi:hypothetical protein
VVPLTPIEWRKLSAGLVAALSEAPCEAHIGAVADGVLDAHAGRPGQREACAGILYELLRGLDLAGACLRLGLPEKAADLLFRGEAEPLHVDVLHARLLEGDPAGMERDAFLRFLGTHAIRMGDGQFLSRPRVPPDATWKRAAGFCASIVLEGRPGRRWATEELFGRLVSAHPDMSGIGPHGLERALDAAGTLFRTRPRVWSSVQPGIACATPSGVAADLLAANGGPMPIRQLTKAVFGDFGARKTRQLLADDRIAPVGAGCWGLVGRDLALDGIDQVATIADAMLAKGPLTAAALLSELESRGLGGKWPDPVALASALRVGAGLRMSITGYLRAKGEAIPLRSGSARHAILRGLAAHPDGISEPDLRLHLAGLPGPIPSDSMVRRIVREEGAMVLGHKDLWTAPPSVLALLDAVGPDDGTEATP